MKKPSFFILIILASYTLQDAIQWSYCKGFDDSKLSLEEIDIDPFPLKRGRKALFEIAGTAKTEIDQKDLVLNVKLKKTGTKIYSTKMGSSYIVPQGGDYDYQLSYGLPSLVPPGQYILDFNIVDSSGNPYTCFEFEVDF